MVEKGNIIPYHLIAKLPPLKAQQALCKIPVKPWLQHSGGASYDNCIGRYVMRYNRASSDYRAVTNFHPPADNGMTAYPDIIAYVARLTEPVISNNIAESHIR